MTTMPTALLGALIAACAGITFAGAATGLAALRTAHGTLTSRRLAAVEREVARLRTQHEAEMADLARECDHRLASLHAQLVAGRTAEMATDGRTLVMR